MAKCAKHSGLEKNIKFKTKVEGKDKSLELCPKCYTEKYNAGEFGGTFKTFDPAVQKTIAQQSYEALHANARIVGKGTGSTEGVDFPERLDSLATTMMSRPTTVSMTCIAIAVHANELIIAENNLLPAWTAFEQLPIISGACEVFVEVDRVVFLSAAGLSVHDLNGQALAAPMGVAIAARANVHSELRVLEYLHLRLGARAATLPNYYIGISKPSCAKCETTIRSYNVWDQSRLVVRHQGHHDSYDAQWKLPRALTAMPLRVNDQALDYKTLKRALKS